jgi:hypothetical protein
MAWNPYEPLAALDARAAEQRRAQAEEQAALAAQLRAALNHPPGRAWLNAMIERLDSQASYRPGDALDVVAWHESRRQMLRELRRALDAPSFGTE